MTSWRGLRRPLHLLSIKSSLDWGRFPSEFAPYRVFQRGPVVTTVLHPSHVKFPLPFLWATPAPPGFRCFDRQRNGAGVQGWSQWHSYNSFNDRRGACRKVILSSASNQGSKRECVYAWALRYSGGTKVKIQVINHPSILPSGGVSYSMP